MINSKRHKRALYKIVRNTQKKYGKDNRREAEEIVMEYIAQNNNLKLGLIAAEENVDKIASAFKLTREQLASKQRKKELVIPRYVTCKLLREQCNMTYKETGALLGGRDHSTIIHAVKQASHMLSIYPAFNRLYINTLKYITVGGETVEDDLYAFLHPETNGIPRLVSRPKEDKVGHLVQKWYDGRKEWEMLNPQRRYEICVPIKKYIKERLGV